MNPPRNGLTHDDWLLACDLVVDTINAVEVCGGVREPDNEWDLAYIELDSGRAKVAVYLTLVVDDGDEYHKPVYAVSIDSVWEMSIDEASEHIKAGQSDAQAMLTRLASAISTLDVVWPQKLYGL